MEVRKKMRPTEDRSQNRNSGAAAGGRRWRAGSRRRTRRSRVGRRSMTPSLRRRHPRHTAPRSRRRAPCSAPSRS